MAKVTKTETSPGYFPQGGKTKMFGVQEAGPQKADTTAHDTKGAGGDWAKGGTGKMFGRQSANTMTPGQSGKP